ncbi:hypothetical protein ACTG9Q_15300 [Actinokineospora sp. 24-640]
MNRLLHPMPGLLWSEIRAAAVECSGHGWPVVPGSYRLTEDGPWIGAEHLAPVDRFRFAAPLSADRSEELWTARPYSILLDLRPGWAAIGITVRSARAVADALATAGTPAPLVATGASAHVIVTTRPAPSTMVHRPWVVLPPGSPCGAVSRWVVPPSACGWAPPSRDTVLAVLREPDSDGPSLLPLSA